MVNTWKIISATAVIFGAGLITGGLLVENLGRVREPQPKVTSGSALPAWHAQWKDISQSAPRDFQLSLEGKRMAFVLRVHKELKLTPEQHNRIEKIIQEGQGRTEALWQTIAPQLQREVQEVKTKILAELTPEQQTRFEELLKQRPQRRVEEAAGPDRRQPKRERRTNAPPAAPSQNPK